MATYIPGNNRVIKAAKTLRPRKKLAKFTFKFVSSGEAKKSIRTAGIITPYGLPFISTTTRPFNRYLDTLSGLSVESISGIPNILESTISCSNSPADSRESTSKLFRRYFTSLTKSLLAIFLI